MSDHDPHGEGHAADDGWCSVNEAARRLGVTPTAIRNRIKRLIAPLDPSDPARIAGEREIARLTDLARHSGDPRGT